MPCAVCRFDPAHYNDGDVRGTAWALPVRWDWMVEGADPSLVAAPAAAFRDAVDRLDGAVDRDALHDATHALFEASRLLPAPDGAGSVAGLFASGGGVPKMPIAEARIGIRGVEGDRQASRQHHGRVWQALCLWSADVVDRLRAEGHPIAPGNAGENVSVRGVDWTSLRPGVRIALGDVLCEVSAYATPCKKNAAWFLDRDFNRMGHEREPGISRLYASVLRDGVVRVGDDVVVEPG